MAHERTGEGEVPEKEHIAACETPTGEDISEVGRKRGEHEHVCGEVCEACGLTGEEMEVAEGEHEHVPGEVCEEVGRKGGEHQHRHGEVCEECGFAGEEPEESAGAEGAA